MARKPRNFIGKSVGVVKTQVLKLQLPEGGLTLERGGVLPEIEVAYEMCGAVREEMDNVVFVCHALTGDAHVAGSREEGGEPDGWWEGMVGSGRGIDTDHYCVVCANILGGCKGTTGPGSTNPATGRAYGSAFPEITVHDIVTVHVLLLRQLGVRKPAAIIGGSFGGMQVLDWACTYPDYAERCIVIASAPALSTQALAFDIIGRRAITQDPSWRQGDYYDTDAAPDAGLAQARRLAHITYLSNNLMADKFGRERRQEWLEAGNEFLSRTKREFRTTFQIESYLDHQASTFIRRFDANSYLHITRSMDEFDLAERFSSLKIAFSQIKAQVLIVSLTGDWLFTPEQSEAMAQTLLQLGKPFSYFNLWAPAGHDAFLTHIDQLLQVVRSFLPRPGDLRAKTVDDELSPAKAEAYQAIAEMVDPGSRVIDIGCAHGRLLKLLKDRRDIDGFGVDIDFEGGRDALDRGLNIVLDDMCRATEEGGREHFVAIPDDAFDTVVLSETLQVMKRVDDVVEDAMRIAKTAVISFPNFAYIVARSQLFFAGHMPKDRHLPFEWYDTPNIHLFTIKDFKKLCKDKNFVIREIRSHAESFLGRLLIYLGFGGLGAERFIVKIERPPAADAGVSRN